MTYQFDENDLTREKSLFSIYLLARRIRPSRLTLYVSFAAAGLLAVNAFWLPTPSHILLQDSRRWAELGLNFATTTLGFLVAGYTIFATLADPKMMLSMMDHIDKETGLPTLKANHIKFMKVMIDFIVCIVLYIFVILYCQSSGLFSNLVDSIHFLRDAKSVLTRFGYVGIGASLVYLVMILQSYVFNVYAVVMNMLRWEYHKNNRR
jgi:hypothetical protein